MTVVTTLDITGLTPAEYRAVLDRMGVETRPEPGIYLHITVSTDFGYRVIEIWDKQEGFEEFAGRRMVPALKALGIDRKRTSPSALCTTSSHPGSASFRDSYRISQAHPAPAQPELELAPRDVDRCSTRRREAP